MKVAGHQKALGTRISFSISKFRQQLEPKQDTRTQGDRCDWMHYYGAFADGNNMQKCNN